MKPTKLSIYDLQQLLQIEAIPENQEVINELLNKHKVTSLRCMALRIKANSDFFVRAYTKGRFYRMKFVKFIFSKKYTRAYIDDTGSSGFTFQLVKELVTPNIGILEVKYWLGLTNQYKVKMDYYEKKDNVNVNIEENVIIEVV